MSQPQPNIQRQAQRAQQGQRGRPAPIQADSRALGLTDVMVAKGFRNELRESACNRFTTVSGPGSDGHHEVHIYFDVIERHQGSRMCQWDVREPSVTDVAAPGPAADTAAGNNGHDCKSCAEIVIVIPSSD